MPTVPTQFIASLTLNLLGLAVVAGIVGWMSRKSKIHSWHPSATQEKWILVGAYTSILLIFLWIQNDRHSEFELATYDAAVYLNRLWRFGRFILEPDHFFGFPSHPFRDHFEPILFILGQLTRVTNNALIILSIEPIIVAAGIFPVYWMGKELFGGFLPSLLFAVAYALSPGIIAAVASPIHPGTWLTTIYAFAIYFAHKGRWKYFYLALFAALLCKETAGAHIFGIGLFVLLWKKEIKVGLLTAAVGLTAIFIVVGVFMPTFDVKSTIPHLQHYSFFGSTLPQIVADATLTPGKLFWFIQNHENRVVFLFVFFAITGYSLVIFPRGLVLLAPFLAELLLAHRPWGIHTLLAHYSAPVSAPFFLVSAIGVTHFIRTRKLGKHVFFSWVLFISLSSSYVLFHPGNQKSILHTLIGPGSFSPQLIERDFLEIAKHIPHDVRLLTSPSLAPRLALRRDLLVLSKSQWRDAEFILLTKVSNLAWLERKLDDRHSASAYFHLGRWPNYSVLHENDRFVLFRKDFDLEHPDIKPLKIVKFGQFDPNELTNRPPTGSLTRFNARATMGW